MARLTLASRSFGTHRSNRAPPIGKVPVLFEDDLVLSESVAIVLYLAEKYPENGFLPADLRARAEVYRWLLFSAGILDLRLQRPRPSQRLLPIARGDAAEERDKGFEPWQAAFRS
jgi:glutathione S-transferase